jgi:hypothetical protein
MQEGVLEIKHLFVCEIFWALKDSQIEEFKLTYLFKKDISVVNNRLRYSIKNQKPYLWFS